MRISSPVDSAVTFRPSIVPVKETRPSPDSPHVPTEGERAAPLRRHEGHVIGQATEGLRRGLLEQVPVDDVGRSGPPPVVHLATEVHPPQIGVQLGIAVLVSQALLSVDGEPAVVGVHAQGVLLAPRVIVRFDLDDPFPELPAEEHIGPIHGQGLGSQEIGGLEQEPVHVGLGQGGSHECSHAIGHLHLWVHRTVHSADRHAAHTISPFNVVSLCVLNAYSSAYFVALMISWVCSSRWEASSRRDRTVVVRRSEISSGWGRAEPAIPGLMRPPSSRLSP